MHSSQNEQDSRIYADFARVLCLEPSNQQETYEMARAAFDLSERFQVPVLLRLVTRLAHSRAPVEVQERQDQSMLPPVQDTTRLEVVQSAKMYLALKMLKEKLSRICTTMY